MATTRNPLRLLLTLVALVHVAAALMLFTPPVWLEQWYGFVMVDPTSRSLAAACGAMLLVFAAGAGVAALHPVRHRSVIALLLLEHMALFIVDVVLVARGEFPLTVMLPEMLLLLVFAAGMIRWFPGPLTAATGTGETDQHPDSTTAPF